MPAGDRLRETYAQSAERLRGLPSALATLVEAELERRGYVVLTLEGRPRYHIIAKDGEATIAYIREGVARRMPEDLKLLADRSGLSAAAICRVSGSHSILQITTYSPKGGSVKRSTTSIEALHFTLKGMVQIPSHTVCEGDEAGSVEEGCSAADVGARR